MVVSMAATRLGEKQWPSKSMMGHQAGHLMATHAQQEDLVDG